MSHLSMILTGIFLITLTIVMAPNIFALNRGHILRNIALWLAIFCGLGLIYQNFGPDSQHPLFQLPASMAGMRAAPAEDATPPNASGKDKDDDGAQGFTPPKE